MSDALVRRYLRQLSDLVTERAADPLAVLSGLTERLASALDAPTTFDTVGPDVVPVEVPEPEPPLLVPDLLGQAYEALLDSDARRRGAHYTPRVVADGLTAIVIDSAASGDTYCDPSCGGGAFLLAIARRLEGLGIDRRTIVEHGVRGFDVDPVAVAVARSSMSLWSGMANVGQVASVADSLGADIDGQGTFAGVAGNPPFQSQLSRRTARSREEAANLGRRGAAAPLAYTDTAWLFLAASLDLVRPGGRVGLIQPQSLLSARDARSARVAVLERGRVAGFWIGSTGSFAAAVEVCAPVVELGQDPTTVDRWVGEGFAPMAPVSADRLTPASWAPLLSDVVGAPEVDVDEVATVADGATATAGFRDEYYGLVPAVRERSGDEDLPRLITVGLVDPLRCRWGGAPARFARKSWSAPVVELDEIDGDRVRRWVVDRLVPKVLVATQTKVLEVVVDERGDLVPVTPMISVHAPPDRLWHLAAALSSPPLTAIAFDRAAGAALVATGLKLSARQVLDLPLPASSPAWDAGAEAARLAAAADDEPTYREAMVMLGTRMCEAYGVPAEPNLAWWLERLPAFRR